MSIHMQYIFIMYISLIDVAGQICRKPVAPANFRVSYLKRFLHPIGKANLLSINPYC